MPRRKAETPTQCSASSTAESSSRRALTVEIGPGRKLVFVYAW
jgi:hypothetical protein